MLTVSPDLLLDAWEAYQASGQCNELAIAPPILRSWQRCTAVGLDPRRACDASSPRAPVLDEFQAALLALARPYMEDLYQFVEGSGFAVLLADADGHLGHAAERLGISRATLWRKMKLYGLTKEHLRPIAVAGRQ